MIDLKKRLAVLIPSLIIILAACFIGGKYYFQTHIPESRILSLEIPPFGDEIILNEGEKSDENYFEVIAENGFSPSDILLVSEDESVAVAKYSFTDRNRYVCFSVTGVSEGETDIYFVSEKYGVLSGKITVTVRPEEIVTEALNVPYSYAPDDFSDEQGDITENDNPSDKTQTEINEEPSAEPQRGDTVWVAPTGKRYHYVKSCAGKNGFKVKKSEAISSGKTPCKKCAGG